MLLPFGGVPSPFRVTSAGYDLGGSQTQQKRLNLHSYFETDSLGTAEVLRIHNNTPLNLQGNSAKGAIAWFEDDVSSSQSKVWVQVHNYLNYYNPITFLPAAVNTSTGVITLAAQNDSYVNAYQVQFSTTGTLPGGLSASTNYYIKLLTSTTFGIYNDYALTSQVTLTTQGSGTHTITPNNDFCSTDGVIFNKHQHYSVEATKSDGQTKVTRFSIPYDYDTTEISTFNANFNVNQGLLNILGSQTSNKQLYFGNSPTPNPRVPDYTNIRWALKQNNTTESGSNVGSDFQIVPFNDSGAAQTSALFIQRSTGFIGIGGVTSPGVALDIGTQSTSNVVRINRGVNSSNSASLILDTQGSDKWSLELHSDSTDNLHIRDKVTPSTAILIARQSTQANMTLLGGSTPGTTWGGGIGVILLTNANTTPSSNPTGGGLLYVSAGALVYRGSSGTVTTIANA